ncbi:geranylgeranylglyceryl/heptaprenylglyceryl phosphate synthase, partial [Bacillus vallismortis]|nr:geranylgeranylglyceryl/heptaprenylglyceryl phosphate synthase [Bacillus vallismortis]
MKHVFKIDPNKDLPDEKLEILCESGTYAVIIGGSDGVTEENVLRMMSKVRRYFVPCFLEVSESEAIVTCFD